jgi:hypothetical protein
MFGFAYGFHPNTFQERLQVLLIGLLSVADSLPDYLALLAKFEVGCSREGVDVGVFHEFCEIFIRRSAYRIVLGVSAIHRSSDCVE